MVLGKNRGGEGTGGEWREWIGRRREGEGKGREGEGKGREYYDILIWAFLDNTYRYLEGLF